METKFTEKDSLAIINEMIGQARNNLQKGSGTSMIFWGYLVSFTAILNVVLVYILPDPNQSTWVWCLMIPGVLIDRLVIDRKIDREAIVKTQIDRVISAAWKAHLYSSFIFLIVIFGFAHGMSEYHFFYLINPIILLMSGMAEFITSKACRFKAFQTGAIALWIGAVACMAVQWLTNSIVIFQFCILAICMIVGFVIPGHQLNKKAKEHV